jgi:hypothetical protein
MESSLTAAHQQQSADMTLDCGMPFENRHLPVIHTGASIADGSPPSSLHGLKLALGCPLST